MYKEQAERIQQFQVQPRSKVTYVMYHPYYQADVEKVKQEYLQEGYTTQNGGVNFVKLEDNLSK